MQMFMLATVLPMLGKFGYLFVDPTDTAGWITAIWGWVAENPYGGAVIAIGIFGAILVAFRLIRRSFS